MTDVLMDKSADLSSCAEKMELVFICMKNKSITSGGSFLVLPVAEKIPCGVVGTGPGLPERVSQGLVPLSWGCGRKPKHRGKAKTISTHLCYVGEL